MCLAVPGRVIEITERDGTRMATVDFGGITKEVCLEYVPELQVGEYTIVHVGFALQRLDEQAALETLELKQTKVTGAGVEKFKQARPACRIVWDGGVVELTAIQ